MEPTNEKRAFVHIDNYTGSEPIQIIYREDKPKEVLHIIGATLPSQFDIEGTIQAPFEWLSKHLAEVRISDCHLTVNREAGTILLTINDLNRNDSFDPNSESTTMLNLDLLPTSTVQGSIQLTREFAKLRINDDNGWWHPVKLAQFFRLNRYLFAKPEDGMVAVTALKNVKAKINADYEKKQELHKQISKTEFFQQEVTHNLPESLAMKLQLFKGGTKEIYEVEIDADIRDGEILVQLVSPAINEKKDSVCDELIDQQLQLFRDLAPTLVIIEE